MPLSEVTAAAKRASHEEASGSIQTFLLLEGVISASGITLHFMVEEIFVGNLLA